MVCSDKLSTYINSLSEQFDDFDEALLVEEVRSKGYEYQNLLRGHFLFSAVAKFINQYSKKNGYKNSISNDSLYAVFVLALETTMSEQCTDYQFFKQQIDKIQIAA
ncbi:hypothetical protein VISI1226_20774 [Vibrio sinaloensis DSM 21326]|uniref:Uncharacterized protein n=1 Tax=Vibrio sinaloensis DSM 21326 TaxID=945550 RepID=E8MAN6_PHOS4|nr:hypothetical protein VISI1226_20774 [Vibrio sinaloensis DSM 21326]